MGLFTIPCQKTIVEEQEEDFLRLDRSLTNPKGNEMISPTVISAVKYLVPQGLAQQLARSKSVARWRVGSYNTAQADKGNPAYSYRAAVEFHLARGLTPGHVVGGSMPGASLSFCSEALDNLFPTTDDRPLMGVHVGNFLGISLGHFVDYVRQRNKNSVVVSIDPNLTHRGISDPQKHVIALLTHFGLQKNAIIIVGYSLNKSLSNDGTAFTGENGVEYDPYTSFQTEQACEDTVTNLSTLYAGRFDFAMVDGNHEGSHLSRETEQVGFLLRPGGVLILDDVSDAWSHIKAEYGALQSKDWRGVSADGRVGLLQRAYGPGSSS